MENIATYYVEWNFGKILKYEQRKYMCTMEKEVSLDLQECIDI